MIEKPYASGVGAVLRFEPCSRVAAEMRLGFGLGQVFGKALCFDVVLGEESGADRSSIRYVTFIPPHAVGAVVFACRIAA